MKELHYIAYRLAEESVRNYVYPFKKSAIWPLALAGLGGLLKFVIPSVATAGIFMGTGQVFHELPYIRSKLTGRGAKEMTPEEQEIYQRLVAEGKSPLYAYQQAVKTIAAKYGLASYLDDGSPLDNLSMQERSKLYERQQKKIDLLNTLTKEREELQDTEIGPWGPTWEQLNKAQARAWQMAPDVSPSEDTQDLA